MTMSPVLFMRVPVDAHYHSNIMNSTTLQAQSCPRLECKLCGQPPLCPYIFIPSSYFEASNHLSAESSLQAKSLPCRRKVSFFHVEGNQWFREQASASAVPGPNLGSSAVWSSSSFLHAKWRWWYFPLTVTRRVPCNRTSQVPGTEPGRTNSVSLGLSLSLFLQTLPFFLLLILSHSLSFFPQRNEIKLESSLRSQTYDTIAGKSRTF